jgi:hypothetical protein
MSVIEDPDPSREPAGPDQPSDDLEHWLSDLRTEVSADPAGWIDKDSAGEQPTPGQHGASSSRPSSGRHRAPD